MGPMAILCTQPSNQCHSSSTCPWCPEFCPVPSTLYVSMFAQMPRRLRESRLSWWNWLDLFHPPFCAWMASCWVLPVWNTPWRPTPWISPAMGRSIATTWCESYRPWTAIPQPTPCPSWRFRSWWFVVSWMPWHQPSANTKSLVWLPRWSWCPLQLEPTTVSLRLLNWPARRLWISFRLIQRNWRIGEKWAESPGPLDGIWSKLWSKPETMFNRLFSTLPRLAVSYWSLMLSMWIHAFLECIFKLCTAQNSYMKLGIDCSCDRFCPGALSRTQHQPVRSKGLLHHSTNSAYQCNFASPLSCVHICVDIVHIVFFIMDYRRSTYLHWRKILYLCHGNCSSRQGYQAISWIVGNA